MREVIHNPCLNKYGELREVIDNPCLNKYEELKEVIGNPCLKSLPLFLYLFSHGLPITFLNSPY
jgi:hypothetical protein